MLAGVPWLLGERGDAPVLGAWWSWGVSILQLLAGLLIVGLALREAVPGLGLSGRALLAALVGGAVVVVGVTLGTFTVSPTAGPPGTQWPFFGTCLRHSALLGAPAVVVAGWLAARALPLRPWLTGALYGLGAGLMTDAAWRLFCNVSSPGHVLSAHGGAVLALTLLGMAVATGAERLRGRRPGAGAGRRTGSAGDRGRGESS